MAKKAVLAGALIAFNSSWKNNQNKIKEELKAHLEREQSSLRARTNPLTSLPFTWFFSKNHPNDQTTHQRPNWVRNQSFHLNTPFKAIRYKAQRQYCINIQYF
jgi:hypothetical protein